MEDYAARFDDLFANRAQCQGFRRYELTTFYLLTNLASPEGDREAGNRELAPADLAEMSRLYALRSWREQSYKQVKNSFGWALYQVRSDVAIRRHWVLVRCAFSLC